MKMKDLLFSSKNEIRHKKIKKINFWTEEEDKILKEIAKKFNYKNWNSIAEYIPGKNSIQCSSRYRRIRPGLIKGTWKKEEDSRLLSLYEKYGKNWAAISKEMPHRTGKQIRDRFLNSLDTTYKRGKFSEEEDKMILKYYKIYGNKWSEIAKKMKVRTGDMVKNRFYSSLNRKLLQNNKSLLKKKRKLSTSKYKINPIYNNFNKNNSKIKKKESIEINKTNDINDKKGGKKDILKISNVEYFSIINEEYKKNYINNTNKFTQKLIVVIDNYKNVQY
jgi:hypothetical protein